MIPLEKKEDFLICRRNELVPMNPKTEYGIGGLLSYRINTNTAHPDSMYKKYNKVTDSYEGESLTAKLFKQLYGRTEQSSDTIFNCWSYFRMFVLWRLEVLKIWIPWREEKAEGAVLERTAKNNLSKIFDGYDNIRQLFDSLADLHHSLANFMPAPKGFNGMENWDGKGTFHRDNDIPDIYYKRAEHDFPQMYKWINDYMDEYSLQFFIEYKSPWSDGNANSAINNANELDAFIKSIEDAIKCIEDRADRLYCKICR